MRRSTILAAVSSVLALASLSQAAFTISAAPSAQPAGGGRVAFDIFALNDAGGTDGSNLQAAKVNFTGANGTTTFFSTFDPGDGTVGVDTWNFGNGAQSGVIIDPNSSNLRIAARTLAQHSFPNIPGDSDSPVTAAQATNGLATWGADYALLSAAVSVPTPTAPGARFARLVFNHAPDGSTIVANLAGETGAGVDYSFTFGGTPPTNTPPVVAPAAKVVVFGQVVSNGAPFSATVNVTDLEGGLLTLAPNGAAVGGTVTGLTITPAGGANSPAAFTVSGTVAYAPFGTIVTIPLIATDPQGATGAGSLVLTLTPEPASLAALGGAAVMGLIRRRK